MKIIFKNLSLAEAIVKLKRCGYAEFKDPISHQTSFVRRLRGFFYPRFHIYIEQKADQIIYNLHLDQKKPSYDGAHAHNGEYSGAVVEQEAERLKQMIH
ncbi:MAG: hypothetical protein PHV78_00140 [Patescibacteria group bacterium]|nr:hypothetical protein [Patescibacteria group bacterium]MDD5121413.1 hypothetical protein [Patescibacteria group bacterium]MDD5221861.1 hypothetical protein [Patescibacteria group bacterium]MDD5395668.1 hypothetical protein [Patescibacteria group bacterium]